jgi:hypothetical protein
MCSNHIYTSQVAEIKAGLINHAIRFTSHNAQPAYAYPASHLVTGREPTAPPSGGGGRGGLGEL